MCAESAAYRLFNRDVCEMRPMDLGITRPPVRGHWVSADMTDARCLFEMRRDSPPAVLQTAGPTLLTGSKWVMSFSGCGRGRSGAVAQPSHQMKRLHVWDCLRMSSSMESCPFPHLLGRFRRELVSINQAESASSVRRSHAMFSFCFWKFSSFFFFF